ncbi:hypothetical protein [Phenylobacterium sp.]|uniref:hypothetical protein n=1 Tax=Phenylobacterium sp. TaxID=1871053 RepID=UPI00272F6662|nr:hypothetical protein [Phenylobacterium sp.]MDP1874565.1 hypothetical protein [Phenylobacterium sp.]MDP3489282.1 hypothetical protein [Phenylobacterium sp.]
MAWLAKVGEAVDNVVSVSPVEGGWSVTCGLADHPLMFISGADAEAKARSLAQLIASAGGDAQVLVHDRRNTLVGTLRYFAEEGAGLELSASTQQVQPSA